MPEYVIEQLLGMNRNAAEGAAEQNPVELTNLIPTRMGGWQTRGYLRTRNPDTKYPKWKAGSSQPFYYMNGYDHQGYATMYEEHPSNNATYRFVMVKPNGELHVGPYGNLSPVYGTPHVPGIGVVGWVNVDDIADPNYRFGYLFETRQSGLRYDRTGLSYPAVSKDTSGSLPTGSYRMLTVEYIATPAGKVVMQVGMWYLEVPASGAIHITLAEGQPDYGVEVYLARDPATGNFKSSAGAVSRPLEYVRQGDVTQGQSSFDIQEIQFGPTLNIGGYGLPLTTILNNVYGDSRVVGNYNGRVYFVPEPYSYARNYSLVFNSGSRFHQQGSPWQSAPDEYSRFTVSWTERGFVNFANPVKNYYTLPAKNSTSITAFTAIQDGLLVFCDNESFLMRGDPAFVEQGRFEDFNFTPYMPLGCDRNTVPGVLGPEVYTVWRGEVYRVSGGQLENITKPVYDRTDPFIQVVGDAAESAVLCLAKSGTVFAFYPEYFHWTVVHKDVQYLLPTPDHVYARGAADALGVDYYQRSAVSGTLPIHASATFETTLGDKHRRKMLRRIRLPGSNNFTGTITAFVTVDGQGVDTINGLRVADEWVFAMPLGTTGYQFEVRFSFRNMRAKDVVEGPIIFDYADRGQKR